MRATPTKYHTSTSAAGCRWRGHSWVLRALPHRPPSPRGAPQGQSSEDPAGVTGVQRSPGEDVHMLVSKHQLAQPTRMSADMSNKEQVFAQLKKDVRSLLISSKLGLDPNQLTRDYGNMLGCPMPLQLLGFGNVLDMAAAMPDVLSVSRGVNGVALLKAVSDTSTKHIEELVAKQRNPKKRNHFHQYQPSPLQHHPFLSIHTLRAQLKILLCQGPLKLCDLNACYLRCFHRPLLPCEFGFDTLGGMLEAVADLIFVQPSNMGLIVSLRENAMPTNHYGLFYTPNWVKTRPPKYSHGRRPKQGKPSEPPSSQPTAVAERKDQEADLELSQKPVLERPSGKDAPPIENSHFPVRPAEGDNGHCTVVDLGSVGQRAHGGGEIKGEGDRCAARARQDETSEISEDSRTPEESAATPPAAEVRHGSAIARDVLGTQRLKRPTPHGVRDLAAVRVEHVESPGHFYVSFVESDEARALQDLMFEMRRCYTCSEVSEHYRLPQRLVRRGQACCVSAIGFWFYRVVIRQVVSATRAEVYFVDYGNTTTVHSADLKFLRARFSVLPAQAVPSSLAGIKPITGTWTPEATSSFQELCSHHVLAGALYSYVGDVLQLYLCDTRTSDDVYVHDVLLSQGHAVACAPPAGAALCAEDSPVTLYLGDGSVDPQEDVAVSLKVEDDEMPDLELIVDEQLSSHFQILNGKSIWLSSP
ncbi:tudor domain-containing protein 5-like isoform X2 [Phyllopteryx taeniolatus]|uniref:tudor domain-containing protein 5-like isoform X2 n=1 Tax=Phyllopteryx taeniolatus TaxID=161469 RepID=UPI002AD32AFE|nr:tudor domain-containing protein 5-like isoform X2 [Phyllopteryx taeniolatus]